MIGGGGGEGGGRPAFASYGVAVFDRAKTEVKNVPITECTQYISVIGRSDAAHKERENPFSPITRPLRNKKGRQVPRAPPNAECEKPLPQDRATELSPFIVTP